MKINCGNRHLGIPRNTTGGTISLSSKEQTSSGIISVASAAVSSGAVSSGAVSS